MGVCMHGDGSEDPLVPWLHKDCPAGGGGCPHPRPLGSPGEDQGDAFCHRCCMLWHPWMHPWHDGPPQTRADVDGMHKHCGCMRQVHACAPTGGTRSVHVHTMQGQVTHPTVLMHPGRGSWHVWWPQLACRPSSAEACAHGRWLAG